MPVFTAKSNGGAGTWRGGKPRFTVENGAEAPHSEVSRPRIGRGGAAPRGDPFAVAAGAGEDFGVGVPAGEKRGEKTGEETVAGADGVRDGHFVTGFPSPGEAIAQQTGAARARGDHDERAAMAGMEGAGMGLFGTGKGGVAGFRETRGLVCVELQEGGARGKVACELRIVVGRAQVDVQDAQGGGRERGEEAVKRPAIERGTQRERPENERICAAGGRERGGRGGNAIPGYARGDPVAGVAGIGEFRHDGTGGQVFVPGDEACIQSPMTQAAEELVAQRVVPHCRDQARIEPVAGEMISHVGGRAPGEEAVGQKIPKDFAVAEDDGGHRGRARQSDRRTEKAEREAGCFGSDALYRCRSAALSF